MHDPITGEAFQACVEALREIVSVQSSTCAPFPQQFWRSRNESLWVESSRSVSLKWWQNRIKKGTFFSELIDIFFFFFLVLVSWKGSVSTGEFFCVCLHSLTLDSHGGRRGSENRLWSLHPRRQLFTGQSCFTSSRLGFSCVCFCRWVDNVGGGIVASSSVRSARMATTLLQGKREKSLYLRFHGRIFTVSHVLLSGNTCAHAALKPHSPFWSPSFLLHPAA